MHGRSLAAARRTAAQLQAEVGAACFTRHDAANVGVTYDRLRQAARSGTVKRTGFGIYRVLPLPAGAHGGEPAGDVLDHQTLQSLRALLRRLPPDAVLGHTTAARFLGLWTPASAPDTTIHVIIPGQADRLDGQVRVHGRGLHRDDVMVVQGIRTLRPSATGVQMARGSSLSASLVCLDGAARAEAGIAAGTWGLGARDRGLVNAALRRSAADPASREAACGRLHASLRRIHGWPGTRAVRRALPLVDPRSESPFESRSRAAMLARGIPDPVLAHEVVGASGNHYWADFAWPEARVLGEADGWSKYGATSDEVRLRLRAERRRQQDLEQAGWRCLRWDPAEVELDWLRRLGFALHR